MNYPTKEQNKAIAEQKEKNTLEEARLFHECDSYSEFEIKRAAFGIEVPNRFLDKWWLLFKKRDLEKKFQLYEFLLCIAFLSISFSLAFLISIITCKQPAIAAIVCGSISISSLIAVLFFHVYINKLIQQASFAESEIERKKAEEDRQKMIASINQSFISSLSSNLGSIVSTKQSNNGTLIYSPTITAYAANSQSQLTANYQSSYISTGTCQTP